MSKIHSRTEKANRMQQAPSVLSRQKPELVEINEQLVINNLDRKRTYFNSIMQSMQPRFKYKKRQNGRHQNGAEEGMSNMNSAVDDDLTSLDFSNNGMKTRVTKTPGRQFRAQKYIGNLIPKP